MEKKALGKGLEALLPDHAGSRHTQRPEYSLSHEVLRGLLADRLHDQLEKAVAFATV